MQVPIPSSQPPATVDLPNLPTTAFRAAVRRLAASPAPGTQRRAVVMRTFLELLGAAPNENPSDLWHHVVYRQFLAAGGSSQSWVRVSGDALELALIEIYNPLLRPHGLSLEWLGSAAAKETRLASLGLYSAQGRSALDIVIWKDAGTAQGKIRGIVNVKASLAERVRDDVPLSVAARARGLFSPLWTLDVKSYPPRSYVNRGEFGTSAKPTDKRLLVEHQSSFDHAFSGNHRTVPTPIGQATPSGQRVIRIELGIQPDAFAAEVISRLA